MRHCKTGKVKMVNKILLTVVVSVFAGFNGYSQVSAQNADSLKVKEQKQTAAELKDQQGKGYAYGKANRNQGSQSAKQVKGGRPDMTKARGARPPMIVRPSGSGIPKGVGRPGGAGKKGGR
jgi:hypothetical protein